MATDIVAVRYMGLNPQKIKYLKYFIDQEYDGITHDNINVILNNEKKRDFFYVDTNYSDFLVVNQWEEIEYKS